MNRNKHYAKQFFFTSVVCLAFFFWMCFFIQTIHTGSLCGSSNVIPAFLNTDSQTASYDITSFLSLKDTEKLCRLNRNTIRIPIFSLTCREQKDSFETNAVTAFLKKFDKNIILVSSHKEKNYGDFYFYSPKLSKTHTFSSNIGFNLQAAVTQKYVYLGIPVISYDF